jgi:hypothetical protein
MSHAPITRTFPSPSIGGIIKINSQDPTEKEVSRLERFIMDTEEEYTKLLLKQNQSREELNESSYSEPEPQKTEPRSLGTSSVSTSLSQSKDEKAQMHYSRLENLRQQLMNVEIDLSDSSERERGGWGSSGSTLKKNEEQEEEKIIEKARESTAIKEAMKIEENKLIEGLTDSDAENSLRFIRKVRTDSNNSLDLRVLKLEASSSEVEEELRQAITGMKEKVALQRLEKEERDEFRKELVKKKIF